MFGLNPLRPPEKGDGLTLEVKHIFPTFQGEGPNAGWPSVFVRLGGCNLACDFCDTEFENAPRMRLADILSKVNNLSEGWRKLVVITGGEPLRQPIAPLCAALLEQGFKVQIETNGTLWREMPEKVEIVCSPKAGIEGYYPLRPDILPRINALKFLVSTTKSQYTHIPELGQTVHQVPIYVQPMDEQNEAQNQANMALATTLAMQNGYHLSIQWHKLAGIE